MCASGCWFERFDNSTLRKSTPLRSERPDREAFEEANSVVTGRACLLSCPASGAFGCAERGSIPDVYISPYPRLGPSRQRESIRGSAASTS